MATTTSSTGNYAASRYSEMIQKQLLEVTDNEYVWRYATESGGMKGVSGHSNQLKINRNRRIAIPMAAVSTEGTAPTPTTLEIDQATGTADQWVMSCQFTDVAEIYAFHDMLSQAVEAVKDAMVRLDEYICSTPFLAATNVSYPDGVSARSGLAAANVINTDLLTAMVSGLRRGPNVYGPAKPWERGQFLGLIHEAVTADLRKDSTFALAETRAQKSEQYEKGIIADWSGIMWKRTNWMPEYTNMATGMASLALDVDATTDVYGDAVSDSTATASLDGLKFKWVEGPGGTFAASTTYDWRVVARHKLRGFAENISSTLTTAIPAGDAGNDKTCVMYTPTSTDYWYDLYQGASGGVLYRVAQNVEGATATTFTTPATTGTVAPVPPAVGVTVVPIIVCGRKAVKAVDLRSLESFITPRTPTHEDPAVQKRTVAAKVFEGAFLVQNEWVRKAEVATSLVV